MRLLVTGELHWLSFTKYAQEHNHEVVVLDDFSTGHKWAVKVVKFAYKLIKVRLSEKLKRQYFDGVVHFAAKSLVNESIIKPDLYYRNNVIGTLNLVSEMLKNDINNIVSRLPHNIWKPTFR